MKRERKIIMAIRYPNSIQDYIDVNIESVKNKDTKSIS